jgi:hypothetical protein
MQVFSTCKAGFFNYHAMISIFFKITVKLITFLRHAKQSKPEWKVNIQQYYIRVLRLYVILTGYWIWIITKMAIKCYNMLLTLKAFFFSKINWFYQTNNKNISLGVVNLVYIICDRLLYKESTRCAVLDVFDWRLSVFTRLLFLN